jgi:hypothetical protein
LSYRRLGPGYRSAHPGYEPGHASSPRVHLGRRASRPRYRPFRPKGRAERLAKSRFRGRPLAKRASRLPFEKSNGTRAVARPQRVRAPKPNRGLGSSFSPAFRTRMDLSACWMSQGWLFLPASPRSCELSPGHALEPSARYTVVCPGRSGKKASPRAPLPGIVADLRAPLRAAKTIAERSLLERDRKTSIPI